MQDRVFIRETESTGLTGLTGSTGLTGLSGLTGSTGFSGLVDDPVLTVCSESRNFGFIIIATGEVGLGFC